MTHPEGCSGESAFADVDPMSMEVVRQFRRLSHLRRQLLMRAVPIAGGHPAQLECLRILGEHEDITQRDLVAILHLSPATITTMLQRIERQGFIERWSDPKDQRLMRIRLSEAGWAMRDKILAAFREHLEATISPLRVEDRRELARLLTMVGDRCADALDAQMAKGPSQVLSSHIRDA